MIHTARAKGPLTGQPGVQPTNAAALSQSASLLVFQVVRDDHEGLKRKHRLKRCIAGRCFEFAPVPTAHPTKRLSHSEGSGGGYARSYRHFGLV